MRFRLELELIYIHPSTIECRIHAEGGTLGHPVDECETVVQQSPRLIAFLRCVRLLSGDVPDIEIAACAHTRAAAVILRRLAVRVGSALLTTSSRPLHASCLASACTARPRLGVGTCVFTTLIWFIAARNTYWLLPVPLKNLRR